MRLGVLIFFFVGAYCAAKIPKNFEPILSRAILAYQEKKWDDAKKLIEEILKAVPEQTEALELEAMIYKAQGKPEEARGVFLKLLNKQNPSEPGNSSGLYAFELGRIFFERKNFLEAKKYLLRAIEEKRNVEASCFLLGKMEWEQNNWKESREYFSKASQAEEYRATAKLFIAEALKNENQWREALGEYAEAKESAAAQLAPGATRGEETRKLNQEIVSTSELALRNNPQGDWSKEVGVASGYDSNVLFSPNAGDSTNVKAEGSVKQSLYWKLQYSPIAKNNRGYRASYQGGINYNFNQQTQGGQFFVHDISNSFSWGNVQGKHYGVKVAGTGALQFRGQGFKPFSLSGSFGPFLKAPLNDGWWVGGEAYFEPVKIYQDNLISSGAKRSGWGQVARIYFSKRNITPFWAPTLYFSGTLMRPSGQEFRGTRFNLDFTNTMILSSKTFLTGNVGGFSASYPDRSLSVRNDKGILMGIATGHQISNPWILMAQLDFQRNFSSDSNFEYQRWSATFSGNYRF